MNTLPYRAAAGEAANAHGGWVAVYQCEATSVAGFVQQVATRLLTNGYWQYVTGWIRADKDPRRVDEKLIAKYGLEASRWSRARRKQQGLANVQYIRHGQFFVLMATLGRHDLLTLEEGPRIRDARTSTIKYAGYSIGYRRDSVDPGRWRASVSIERVRYKELKAHLLDVATHRSVDAIVEEFWSLPFEPYAPVRRQLFNILRAVNVRRRLAGYESVPWERAVRMKRRQVRVFGGGSAQRTLGSDKKRSPA